MWVMTPTYRPVGGVVKIFDYVRHALDLGIETVIACPAGVDRDSALWRIDAFRPLLDHPGVRLLVDGRIAPAGEDLVFFSWPDHWDLIAPRLPDGFPLGRVVHIIQNTRHANPHFLGGRAVRTLARPMTRIVINDQVLQAITPFLNREGATRVIPLGHRADFFRHRREPGFPSPITVGYTTWKSDLGDRVAAHLADDDRMAFRAIRGPVGWDELRELYVASDVFLCTPSRQEGFYLPGLEAMAADSLVVTPDVEGNLAYCSFGGNCVEVPFEDEAAYAACLRDLLQWAPEHVAKLRATGRETAAAHAIEREATDFADLLSEIDAEPGPEVVRPAGWRPAIRRPTQIRVIAGFPGSGTTLATRLLRLLPDVVALDEPLDAAPMLDHRDPAAVLDGMAEIFAAQRRSAVQDGVVLSRERRGGPPTPVRLNRPVTAALTLVVTDLELSGALLDLLRRRFPVTAMVRNPADVLATWEVDPALRCGPNPLVAWFSEDLDRRLAGAVDERERRLELLDWWFAQVARHVPPEHVVRYEDVLASHGGALRVVVPAAGDLPQDVDGLPEHDETIRPPTPDVRRACAERVRQRPDAAWWAFYDPAELGETACTSTR